MANPKNIAAKFRQLISQGYTPKRAANTLEDAGHDSKTVQRLLKGTDEMDDRALSVQKKRVGPGLIKKPEGRLKENLIQPDTGVNQKVPKLDLDEDPFEAATKVSKQDKPFGIADAALMTGGSTGIAAGVGLREQGLKEPKVLEEDMDAPPPAPEEEATEQASIADIKEPEEKKRAILSYAFDAPQQEYAEMDPKIAEDYKKAVASSAVMADEALSLYKKERDARKSAQLWEKLVNAFGMIASGIIGLRTGTDMSGVEFSETDWKAEMEDSRNALEAALKISDRKAAAAARKRSMAVSDMKSVNDLISKRNQAAFAKARGQVQAKMSADSANMRGEQIDEASRHNKVMEGIADDKAAVAAIQSLAKGDKSKQTALVKAAGEISAAAGKDKETKLARYEKAKTILKTAGVPYKEADFTAEGIFFDGPADPADIIKAISGGKSKEDGDVMVKHRQSGQVRKMTAEEFKKFQSKNNMSDFEVQ
ncbi:hypothetical protein OAF54_00070 [bacterium]|nr:hypothetical protein [bacterium]